MTVFVHGEAWGESITFLKHSETLSVRCLQSKSASNNPSQTSFYFFSSLQITLKPALPKINLLTGEKSTHFDLPQDMTFKIYTSSTCQVSTIVWYKCLLFLSHYRWPTFKKSFLPKVTREHKLLKPMILLTKQ